MHKTNSPNIIGNIDGIIKDSEFTQIDGWLVSKNKNLTSKDIKIIDSSNQKELKVIINTQQRKDVATFYQTEQQKYLESGFKIKISKKIPEVSIFLNDEEAFNINLQETQTNEVDTNIKLNKNSKPQIIVVDNFYENPDKVRQFALKQEFFEEKEFYKGKRTKKSYVPSWIQNEFERLLQKKITEFIGSTGIFQYCTSQDALVYHYDLQEYAAIVYLTPDAPLETGTSTYRSKLTGMTRAASPEDEQKYGMSVADIDFKTFNGNNFYDKTNMELVDQIANVYNRLIIFDARLIHASSGYFGSNKENGRLFHLFFFNCE